jgi:hypothetical protein
LKEALNVAHLGGVVVFVDLGTELHLFDHDVRGLLARFFPALILLVLVFAVIHDPANGRIGPRGYLYEIQTGLTRHVERLGKRFDSYLTAVSSD